MSTPKPVNLKDEHASAEEAADAVRALPSAAIKRLVAIAENLCHARVQTGSERHQDADDVFQEAVLRTITGRKRWRRSVSIEKHLCMAMGNISGHAAERSGVSRVAPEAQPIEEEALGGRGGVPRPFQSTVEHTVSVKEEVRVYRERFSGDPVAFRVLELESEGRKASEIRQLLGIDVTEYATIRKRIRRRLVKLHAPPAEAP